MEKTCLSAFFQTNSESAQRALNADTVLITGMLTNQCVVATSKDAMFCDFKLTVIEESTGTPMPHLRDTRIEMMHGGWCAVRGLESTLGEISQFSIIY